MTTVTTVTQDHLAWELVEQHRDCLSETERHTVFVDLGTGEYARAIHGVLTALTRHRRVLPHTLAAELHTWMMTYGLIHEFESLLRAVSPAEREPS
jgi:hypothetical protein